MERVCVMLLLYCSYNNSLVVLLCGKCLTTKEPQKTLKRTNLVIRFLPITQC